MYVSMYVNSKTFLPSRRVIYKNNNLIKFVCSFNHFASYKKYLTFNYNHFSFTSRPVSLSRFLSLLKNMLDNKNVVVFVYYLYL